MDKQKIYLEFLPILARVTGSYAAITDLEGRRIKTVDAAGRELPELKGKVYDLALQAKEEGTGVMGLSVLEEGAEAWCLPLDSYILCCSNIERIKRDKQLKDFLLTALPYISQVVGGEAVIFNAKGERLATYDSKGRENLKFKGVASEAARECMELQRPIIGKSMSVNGAKAVRIPITADFGIGFNNEDTILRNNKLYDEVKKYQSAKYNFSDIIGDSSVMQRAKELSLIAAKSTSNVLIYGETGTGKELFAHAIHNAGDRRIKPFVAINCAALPPSLIESNLFGYDSGAFTGARKGGSAGIFEQANGGTLLLDEISEMDLDLQSKLLRVLQEREVTRIGGRKNIPLDIRIISSSNKPLDQLVQSGEFRQDLYYRLNVIDIQLPPLRNIKEDVPLLIEEAINKMNLTFGKNVKGIDEEAMQVLQDYEWQGNVRELFNIIEKSFNIIGKDDLIRTEHLNIRKTLGAVTSHDDKLAFNVGLSIAVKDYEKKLIEQALKEAEGVKYRAAQILKISTTTLWRKMKELQLEE